MNGPLWGVESEYGRLTDVLVCPPDNYRWLPTSAISRATLESGRLFDPKAALVQHGELLAAYEQAGVTVHRLEADAALPYQVFARDSSAMTPWGAFITQLKQWWRRGEYAPAIRFYQDHGIPIWRMATAGAIEGGDVMIVEPGSVVIGNGEERTENPIPGVFVHIDVLMAVVGPKLAAVCTGLVSGGLLRWLTEKGFDILEVSSEDAFALGVNAISLGEDRVLTGAGARSLNEQMRARGLELFAPDLEMFTLGGGGAHCLGQALRREPA
jgi:N-dimethylarginine dimethylaminohydrolase